MSNLRIALKTITCIKTENLRGIWRDAFSSTTIYLVFDLRSQKMKWFTRIIIVTTMSLSLAINGLLLITQAGFDFLTGLHDNIGVNTPVTMVSKEQKRLQKTNQDLKKKNARLNKAITAHKNTINKQETTIKSQKTTIAKHVSTIDLQKKNNSDLLAKNTALRNTITKNKNTIKMQKGVITRQKSSINRQNATLIKHKKAMRNYASFINNSSITRAARIVSSGTAKTAAALVPAAANAALIGSLVLDGYLLVDMCDNMVELEKSITEFDDNELLENTKNITGEVCAMKIVEVSESEAEELLRDFNQWSEEAQNAFLEVVKAVSDDVKTKIPDVCSLTNNKMWGCTSVNN